MALDEKIGYIRHTETGSQPVDINNNLLSENKYAVINYSTSPTMKLRPIREDGTPYTLADFADFASYVYGIDDDFDRTTTPLILAQSSTTTFTLSEVVVNDTTYVQIAFVIDALTEPFDTAIGTSRELRTNIYAELSAFKLGESQASLIMQYPFVLQNKMIEVVGGIPSGSASIYYTSTQTNALFEKIVKQNSITIPDDSANYLYLASIALYRSVDFKMIIQDTSDNYNKVEGYVTHDGTVATAYVDQDDMGGAMIETLTYTADISGGTMRLIITASSVGESLTGMYGITNIIADSNYSYNPYEVYGLTGWWDANQIDDLDDLDTVATWIDVTGVYTALQSTPALQPIYKTNQINGLPAIDFESDNLESLFSTLVPESEQTIFVVFTIESLGERILFGSVDSGNNCYLGINATGNLVGGVGSQDKTTIVGTTAMLADNTPHIGMLKYNGTTVNLALDGKIEYAAAQVGAVSNTQGMYIGALNTDGSPGSYWDGLIPEPLHYSASLSNNDTNNIVQYAINKYNIS